MSQRIVQNKLDELREWYKVNHDLREEETERLNLELRKAEARLQQIEDYLDTHKSRRKTSSYEPDDMKRQEVERPYQPDDMKWQEVERQFQFAYEWTWKIKRRRRELLREEREDLEWLDKLEGRPRARE